MIQFRVSTNQHTHKVMNLTHAMLAKLTLCDLYIIVLYWDFFYKHANKLRKEYTFNRLKTGHL
jgi:hypothetical protein